MRLLSAIATALAACTLCSPTFAAAQEAPLHVVEHSTLLASAIDGFAADVLANRKVAGFAVGVMVDDKLVFAKGYGLADIEHAVPLTDQTVFRIASLTKQFTAAAVVLLAERGRLDIDDPIAKYLPDFPRGEGVTIRHLLTHTAGVHEYTQADFMGAPARVDHSTAEMVEHISSLKPLYDFEPGTAWRYSNSGYILLQAIIEKASGQSYRDFLQESVIAPLGLKHTQVDDLSEIVANRAYGYELAQGSPSGYRNADYISLSVAGAAGTMRSTVADLLKWHAGLLGHKLFSKAALAEMIKPAVLKDGRRSSLGRLGSTGTAAAPDYGFGFNLETRQGRRMIGHGGTINGLNALIQSFPDQRTSIVILTNTPRGAYDNSDKLIAAVLSAIDR